MNAQKPSLSHMSTDTGRNKFASCGWYTGNMPAYRPTWAEIDLKAFRNNFLKIKSRLKKKTKILAVVKANAYGHSAVPLSQEALKLGAAALGVSSLEEGIVLRENGVKGEILILGSIYPLENLAAACQYDLIPTISSVQGLAELARVAKRCKKRLPFHLKTDTGMGRIGVSAESAPRLLEKIVLKSEVKMAGMYTHFACADSDKEFTQRQLLKFNEAVRRARLLGLEFSAHAANSAALFKYKQAHLDMVRPGISLYGMDPFAGAEKMLKLEPVLSWKTRIVYLKKVKKNATISYGRTYTAKRPAVIATLPVGYADGYSRGLSNKGEVLIRSKRCPVVGRVTMDMIMVDATNAQGVEIGDEAVLIGRQGDAKLTAENMAAKLNTINYEVTCGISYRVPRIII
ncbi:MAG: alanine racemase [Elusimicrobiota bacterium]